MEDDVALINFGKQEIEDLKNENNRLSDELVNLKTICANLNEQIEMKDMELINAKNHIKQIEVIIEKYEKLQVENRELNIILNNPERSSKATVENLKMIRDFKSKGDSYRQISINIREATGKDLSYSTVRYLYKKYIENDEQRS
jgi:hypothetical protein